MAFTCNIPAVPTVQDDNERVRITRWDFAPGGSTGWHEHGLPYCVVMVTGGTLAVHDGQRVSRTTLVAGQSYTRPAGIRHDVMNESDHPLTFIEVEFKSPGDYDALA